MKGDVTSMLTPLPCSKLMDWPALTGGTPGSFAQVCAY